MILVICLQGQCHTLEEVEPKLHETKEACMKYAKDYATEVKSTVPPMVQVGYFCEATTRRAI